MSIGKVLFAVTCYCFVQGHAFAESLEKYGTGATCDRVDVKADIVSVHQCASMCVNRWDCDGIQYMANKACVFLANIEGHTVIGYSPNADTYVRTGRIHIASKLDLFVSIIYRLGVVIVY